MSVVSADIEPLTFVFADDGLVPNNPMPFLVYKGAVDVANGHPEKTIEGLFGANGWGAMWRNGVYDYLHYHATVHEALGVARGHARGAVRRRPRQANSRCRPATSPSCPPAPGINACPPARISRWSAPIRPVRKMQITRPTPENHREGAEDDSAGEAAGDRSGARRERPAGEIVEGCDLVFRHCEPTGRASARPMTGAAKQSIYPCRKYGLPRRFAPLHKRFAFAAGNDD